MREIKFRGKRYGDGAWVYGNLYQGTKEDEQYSIILDDAGYDLAPEDDRNLAIAFPENEVNVVLPDTVGQFTGLLDKNGKEIYEGDIVQQYWGFPHYRNGVRYECYSRIGKVLFDKSGCFVLLSESLLYHLFGDGLTQEVIGNIHDNPELLSNDEHDPGTSVN